MPETDENSTPKHRLLTRILIFLLALILIAAGLLAFKYRDRLFSGGRHGDIFGELEQASDQSLPYQLESGSRLVTAATAKYLAVSTTSGAQLFGGSGEFISRRFIGLTSPAIAPFDDGAAFFDVGGTSLVVLTVDGKSRELTTSYKLITVSANKSGRLAVVTEEPGDRSLVTIYDKKLTLLHKRYFATLTVLAVKLSPDGSKFTVSGIDSDGTSLSTYSLSGEDPVSTVKIPGRVFFDLGYLSASSVCALSLEGVTVIDPDSGKIRGTLDLNGQQLTDYSLGGSGFLTIITDEYSAGIGGSLITIDSNGSQKASLALDRTVTALDANGSEVMLLCGDTLILYSSGLTEKSRRGGSLGISSALLIGKGRCLAVYSRTAEAILL